jgi:hypothetical protein
VPVKLLMKHPVLYFGKFVSVLFLQDVMQIGISNREANVNILQSKGKPPTFHIKKASLAICILMFSLVFVTVETFDCFGLRNRPVCLKS